MPDDPLQIGRKPAIPIYRMMNLKGILDDNIPANINITNSPSKFIPKEYEPGRIIWDRKTQMLIDNCPDYLLSLLGPNDILSIPLYRHGGGGEDQNARDTTEKIPQFKRNMEFAIEASDIIKKILVGNQNSELYFPNGCPFEEDKNMGEISEAIANFVRDATNELRDFGIEPMYASPVMRGDCYYSQWLLRDTLIELGVWNFWAMPFQGIKIISEDKQNSRESIPFPALRKYLSGAYFLGGVNFHRGLRFGMDEFLKFMGFKAGVMGGKVGQTFIEHEDKSTGENSND